MSLSGLTTSMQQWQNVHCARSAIVVHFVVKSLAILSEPQRARRNLTKNTKFHNQTLKAKYNKPSYHKQQGRPMAALAIIQYVILKR